MDAWLGSENYANLVLRFLIYGVVLLAGYKIAKGFDAQRSIWLIVGPVGLTVLALVAIATVVPFFLANTTGSSTGLGTLPDQSAGNVELIKLYTLAGRFYPAFVAACLMPATDEDHEKRPATASAERGRGPRRRSWRHDPPAIQ